MIEARERIGIEGDIFANLVRVLAVLSIYCVEIVNFFGIHLPFLVIQRDPSLSEQFHLFVTTLVLAWTCTGLLVHCAARTQIAIGWSKYFVYFVDLLLLTAIILSGDGPKSSLTPVYFLVLTLSVLRNDPRLLRFTTYAGIAAYLTLVAKAALSEPQLMVPNYTVIIFLITMLGTSAVLTRCLTQLPAPQGSLGGPLSPLHSRTVEGALVALVVLLFANLMILATPFTRLVGAAVISCTFAIALLGRHRFGKS